MVVPAGTWLTGPIHFKSNVNLCLEENAVLNFTDNPSDYLPAVMTSWEGLECYNYSPLLYAFECENVAITGKGTLQPKMDAWRVWFKRPQPHLEALKELYTKASTNVPVIERQMAIGENHLRPHLIHFNRCKNVLLDGFKIRESPFWTIHLYMCDGGVVRNLDVKAHGHNNDGIDFEMSRNFLVEDCSFDQGDDAVVIKAGRNQDAWRLNTPCENIVIRRCQILKGHTLLGIGSEISGGIRNIYMHDCTAPNSVMRLFFVKTNHRRGGFIENVYMKNVQAGIAQRVLEIDTSVSISSTRCGIGVMALTAGDGTMAGDGIVLITLGDILRVIGAAGMAATGVAGMAAVIGDITTTGTVVLAGAGAEVEAVIGQALPIRIVVLPDKAVTEIRLVNMVRVLFVPVALQFVEVLQFVLKVVLFVLQVLLIAEELLPGV